MSSFVYPNSHVRKLYGVQGLRAMRRLKLGRQAAQAEEEKKRLIAQSKIKPEEKKIGFLQKTFRNIKSLFRNR